jgi:transposase
MAFQLKKNLSVGGIPVMKKHTYRTKNVNQINWLELRNHLNGQPVIFAIDVAKEQQYALLNTIDDSVSHFIKWPLFETPNLINELTQLNCPITVVMEATGTYGDAMRYQFKNAGFNIYQVHAKQVNDAKEIYDGVPSLHDAKSAYLIARLHKEGCTKPWHELNDNARELNAAQREYGIHQDQYERNRNRLEAYLSRHWPEVLVIVDLTSVTLENLLINYGSPQDIATNAEEAVRKMKIWGRHFLSDDKINQIIVSAQNTIGVPCIEAERQYLQALAREMQHSRCEGKIAKQQIEGKVQAMDGLEEMARLIGKLTTAVLISLHLDPRLYVSARCFLKALGLNLKEKSSGQIQGPLKLSKRGSSTARKYLFLAALRLIQNDPIIAQWYQKKLNPNAKMKMVAACMRKLAKALWHVARGEKFNAAKLVTL